MLTAQLRSIFVDLLANYQKINIERILDQTIGALQNKSNNNYSSIRNVAFEMIQNAESNLDSRLDSFALRHFFHDSLCPSILPRDVLQRLKSLMSPDFNLAGVSSEALLIKEQIERAKNEFSNFIKIADLFGLSDFRIPSDRILFAIKINNASISGSMKVFSDKIDIYEKFFRLCAQYALSSNDHVELKHVSMSDLLIFLETTKEYMAILLPIWKSILDYAVEIVKLKSIMLDLAKPGVSAEQLDSMRSAIEQASLASMVSEIASIANNITHDSGRTAEIKSTFEQTCKLVATDVSAGTTLELHTKADIVINLIASLESSLERGAAEKLLLEHQKLQEQIATLRNLEPQPLLPRP